MKQQIKQLAAALFLGLTTLAATPQIATAQTTRSTQSRGARDIVKEIIDVVGLTPRFEMREADIDNAAAVIMNGRRYILYNTNFLNEVNSASRTDWAAVSILAHEIGHHLNGHTLSRSSNPADELEADEFSGFVLRKMGASLAEAQAAMAVLSEERDSYTHPGRDTRLAAISTGWKNANNQLVASSQPVSDQPVALNRSKKSTQTSQLVPQPVALDNRFILTKVVFQKAPKEEFYVTTRGNLVRVKNNQLEIIGKLAQTNMPDYPFVFKSSKIAPLFISRHGIIYNENGQKLGWLA